MRHANEPEIQNSSIQSIPTVTTPILVTGASGYIASHAIKLLLERGYKVRGTVRSLEKKEKYQFLYNLVPSKNANLTLVEGDLSDPKSWQTAVEGVEYILHIASPLPSLLSKDEDEIIKPAVAGTVNVLDAALEKGVKRVVVTSSGLAIYTTGSKVHTEDDWADPEKNAHYPKSKILAEKAAWEFYEKNKDKIDVVVINPALVFGPMFTKHGNSSEALMAEIVKNSFPGIPDPEITWPIVDVRDTAEAHIKALFLPEAKGKRYIASGGPLTSTHLVEILEKEFSKYGYIFPSKKVTAQEIKDSGNPIAQRTAVNMGKVMSISNQRSLNELKMQYYKVEETVVDMANSLIDLGIVEDKRKK